METESSPQLTKPKTHKNKPTNNPEERTEGEPLNNSVELPGLNTIKMSNKIIQWKCRGIRANYEELLLVLNKYNPKVVSLQETFLKDKNQLNIKYFQSYNNLYKDGHRVSGSVSILVRKDIPPTDKTTRHKPVHICSIYIPLHDPINNRKLNKLIEQIPKPHILLGDLKSQYYMEMSEKQQKGHWSGECNQQ